MQARFHKKINYIIQVKKKNLVNIKRITYWKDSTVCQDKLLDKYVLFVISISSSYILEDPVLLQEI